MHRYRESKGCGYSPPIKPGIVMFFRRSLFPLIAFFSVVLPAVARSASPEGLWLVEDQTARIRIEKCGNEMWGTVAWLREAKKDVNNPNPALRGRSMTGTAVLIGMKPAGAERWEGEVYNARDGKTYNSKMAVTPAGALEIKGCVLGGLICGGENWKRLAQDPPGTAPKNNCAVVRAPR
jgi:uncharacterized protein (DUF2147 family)